MGRIKPKFVPSPRFWNEYQSACFMNMCESNFREHVNELEKTGFPPRDPLTNARDSEAIKEWANRRSKLGNSDENELDGVLDQWHP